MGTIDDLIVLKEHNLKGGRYFRLPFFLLPKLVVNNCPRSTGATESVLAVTTKTSKLIPAAAQGEVETCIRTQVAAGLVVDCRNSRNTVPAWLLIVVTAGYIND
jgi:hypothetical protein